MRTSVVAQCKSRAKSLEVSGSLNPLTTHNAVLPIASVATGTPIMATNMIHGIMASWDHQNPTSTTTQIVEANTLIGLFPFGFIKSSRAQPLKTNQHCLKCVFYELIRGLITIERKNHLSTWASRFHTSQISLPQYSSR